MRSQWCRTPGRTLCIWPVPWFPPHRCLLRPDYIAGQLLTATATSSTIAVASTIHSHPLNVPHRVTGPWVTFGAAWASGRPRIHFRRGGRRTARHSPCNRTLGATRGAHPDLRSVGDSGSYLYGSKDFGRFAGPCRRSMMVLSGLGILGSSFESGGEIAKR
jgi:hypothetical protein